MKRPLTLCLGLGTADPLELTVDQNGATRLTSPVKREACPYCNDVACRSTCSDSIPGPGEYVGDDIFDRIAHNGKLDGAEAAFLAVVSSFKKIGLLEGNAEQMARLAKAFDDAWIATLDAIANHAD